MSPAPGTGELRLKLTVAYDGSGFHGFAAQDGVDTVGGRMAEAIAKVAGREVELVCAGRTDTGVHARAQVVHCDLPDTVEPAELARSLNRMLGPPIVVRDCRIAAEGFDARRSALSRRYSYTILNSPTPSPFSAATAWHIEEPLDVHALMLSADPLIGEHDFSSFCRRPPGKQATDSLVRRVLDARWSVVDGLLDVASRLAPGAAYYAGPSARDAGPPASGGAAGAAYYAGPSPRDAGPPASGGAAGAGAPAESRRSGGAVLSGPVEVVLRFEITATAFCHQMVRSVVGTMVEMGRGRRHAGEMAAILRARDRAFAATPAPPHGLVLEQVTYPEGM